jgi:hypothetical protein
MTTFQAGSAKIYQFPVGGRAKQASNVTRAPGISEGAARAPQILSADGWYHEAAMQAAEPPKTN